MAANTPEKATLIKRYIKKYPNMKKLTLAKLIYRENGHLFNSVGNIRKGINYYTGSSGEKHRKIIVDKSLLKPLTHDTRHSLIKIKSKSKGLKVFKLPTAIKRVLFLSDIHIPYQDDQALHLAIKYGLEKKVDCIYLNGDIMDMYQVSDHEKLPGHSEIAEEFEMTIEFLKNLRSIFPKATIYYKEGNHERRWMRYLMRKSPELLGCSEFELPIILKFAENKIHWIENEMLVKFGKLNVIHGNEFKGGGGVNPARALYMRARANVIAGDKHKTGENNEGTLDDKLITCWSVACLCELNPKYMPFGHTIWNHGFAYIEMSGDNFHVKNFRIKHGRIL